MKYRILTSKATTRKAMFRTVLRWFFYAVVLLVFYMWEINPVIFGTFQPLLIVPLATAVAMYENEFSGTLFGVFCGLMMDIASGTLLGFTSMWLMLCCLGASLLTSNLIKLNVINHLWITLVSCAFVGFMDFVFVHYVWERQNAIVSLTGRIIPSLAGAVIFAPVVYFLTKFIYIKLGLNTKKRLNDIITDADDEEKVRE